MALYQIAILGKPSAVQWRDFKRFKGTLADRFKIDPSQIEIVLKPANFQPDPMCSAVALFFGGKGTKDIDVSTIVDLKKVPILPVVSKSGRFSREIPPALAMLNALNYEDHGPTRVFATTLECLGLVPRQRRIFLSYRQAEATSVAIQLFAELSARHFDVFLDTHRIDAAVDFQESLWHTLCDVDVLIMLDTPDYFGSRWTAAEYGRALAKGIGILRVQWPDVDEHHVTGTSSLVELTDVDFADGSRLTDDAIHRVCTSLEDFRSLAHATRHLSMVSTVKEAISQVGGRVEAVDAFGAIQVTLRSGRRLLLQPTLGVPTAVNLHTVMDRAGPIESALVFDHIGLRPDWLAHMEWLRQRIKGAQWVRQSEAAYEFGGWET
ncbi:MAG TPA: toll/interleukin-1 receptor domain-containing protein [Chthoniobacteraceae bacterium]|nr:toll/interleukin-1 receptor domain-containing protein [Chthoniobacteraceae bacterium]